ncbi:hypothetical protein AB0H92_45065, partial [Streptomyces phaeochromogenes]
MGEVVYDQREVKRSRYAVAVVFAVHGAVTGSFATRVPWIQDHASGGPWVARSRRSSSAAAGVSSTRGADGITVHL